MSSHEIQAQEDDPHTIRMDFEPPLYQCFENCGSLKLTVARRGGDAGVTVKVCVALMQDSRVQRNRNQSVLIKPCVCYGREAKSRHHRKQNSEVISLTTLAAFLVLV